MCKRAWHCQRTLELLLCSRNLFRNFNKKSSLSASKNIWVMEADCSSLVLPSSSGFLSLLLLSFLLLSPSFLLEGSLASSEVCTPERALCSSCRMVGTRPSSNARLMRNRYTRESTGGGREGLCIYNILQEMGSVHVHTCIGTLYIQ